MIKEQVCNIEPMNWDSLFFNFKVGKVVFGISDLQFMVLPDIVQNCIDEGRKNGYKILYMMLPKDIYLSEASCSDKLFLADRKIVYSKLIPSSAIVSNDEVHSYLGKETNHDLLRLALESGKYSRYKTDVNFPKEVFEQMYTTWITRSVKREIADDILVYEKSGNILGFLTYSVTGNHAVIGLIAVDPAFQGKHIGTLLIQKLEKVLSEKKVSKLSVATQSINTNACSFYEKNLFAIKEIINIYHCWL